LSAKCSEQSKAATLCKRESKKKIKPLAHPKVASNGRNFHLFFSRLLFSYLQQALNDTVSIIKGKTSFCFNRYNLPNALNNPPCPSVVCFRSVTFCAAPRWGLRL
jgi:hypothetical protein